MDRDALDQLLTAARDALESGGLVCFPTESSYGLAARLDRPAACSRLGALKERDSASPFPVIAPDALAARALTTVWPTVAAELAERYWPGPLTIVLPAGSDLPPEVVGPSGGVGVRVSPHPIAAALAGAAGPITATSANRRGQPPVLRLDEARREFRGESITYVDGGVCQGGLPSTVVSFDERGEPVVLRRGAIALHMV